MIIGMHMVHFLVRHLFLPTFTIHGTHGNVLICIILILRPHELFLNYNKITNITNFNFKYDDKEK